MDLDYFKLIDRIVDLNLDERTIIVEAQVPQKHTIFEGHFPGFPIMPGVLLTEAMAQSSGWLLLGVLKFERMPFLAIVKEAKMRGFVSPGQLLTIEAKVEHEGSGFAVTKAKGRIGKELKCSAEITFGLSPFPADPSFRGYMDARAKEIGFPLQALTHD
jgi:3-hydroxyacyl-[acyl-carrier-protein] dehydratase